MTPNSMPYPGGFVPGDEVQVIGGTFVGMAGRVVSPEEAQTLRQTFGGQRSVRSRPEGFVWVELPIFERTVPVLLRPYLLKRGGGS
jgi:transcription antitermination factor NusG